MKAAETRAFMKRLAQFVADNHLKKDATSEQRGMIYEYFWVEHKGRPDQFIEGEALDTMHDGAWFAAAMVNAYRATGDPFYKELLTQWQLPFYLKMLNHSDTLFSPARNDAKPDGQKIWSDATEWLLQPGEKGFVPYWWDDGGSVSFERLGKKEPRAFFPCTDNLAGKPNPEFRLNGYSHGSSNHMAQDLAVMLQQAWLLLRESNDEADKKLTVEIAEAARNLQACRTRHGSPNIPACLAAAALTNSDAELMKHAPDQSGAATWTPNNAYLRALYDFKPGQRYALPGFADDQEYRYCSGIAKHGTLPKALAFKTIYDAFTLPKLYQLYSDDAEVPAGINKFDLHPMYVRDGKLEDYRSDRKGPFKRPRPIGSRFGPQNMVVCGWALQALKTWPGISQERVTKELGNNESQVKSWLEHELGGGLRTWEAIFNQYGYIPTGIGAGNTGAGMQWDQFSDTGGYAHLISAAAQWLLCLENKRDWEIHHLPAR